MKRVLLFAVALTILALGAATAAANAGPPQPRPIPPNAAIAAVAGGVGAVLAGLWIVRRPKP